MGETRMVLKNLPVIDVVGVTTSAQARNNLPLAYDDELYLDMMCVAKKSSLTQTEHAFLQSMLWWHRAKHSEPFKGLADLMLRELSHLAGSIGKKYIRLETRVPLCQTTPCSKAPKRHDHCGQT